MSTTLDLTYRYIQTGSREKRTITEEYHLDHVTLEDPDDGTFHAVLTIQTSHSREQRGYYTRVGRHIEARARGFVISRGGLDFGAGYPVDPASSFRRTPTARFSVDGMQIVHRSHTVWLTDIAGGLDALLAYAADAINQDWAQR